VVTHSRSALGLALDAEIHGGGAEIAPAVVERVKALVCTRFELAPDTLALDQPLDAVGIDSLAAIELLFDLEQAFGVTLSEERSPIRTVADIARLVQQELAARTRGT
jgi:acyl carrier protein